MENISSLVAQLQGGPDKDKESAAEALMKLARNADNRVPIAKAGGIEPLVQLARNGSDEAKKFAAEALWNLAVNSPHNKVSIAKAGGIEPLVQLAWNGSDEGKVQAAGALKNLAFNDDNKVAIAKAGGIEPLVQLARNGSDEAKVQAAGALKNLAFNDDNKVAIAKAGGIEPLVQLARNGSDEDPHPLSYGFVREDLGVGTCTVSYNYIGVPPNDNHFLGKNVNYNVPRSLLTFFILRCRGRRTDINSLPKHSTKLSQQGPTKVPHLSKTSSKKYLKKKAPNNLLKAVFPY